MIWLHEFETIEFRLTGISIEEFTCSDGPPLDEQKIVICVDLDWDLVVPDRRIVSILRVAYNSGGETWLSSQINCQFQYEIYQEEDDLLVLENIRQFPSAFLEQLGTITVGAARGILHERTSAVRPVLLPLLDIKKMVEDEPFDHFF